jgi:hypothetical protein
MRIHFKHFCTRSTGIAARGNFERPLDYRTDRFRYSGLVSKCARCARRRTLRFFACAGSVVRAVGCHRRRAQRKRKQH